MSQTIAYQGATGANSEIACNRVYPDAKKMPYTDFDGALHAVKSGEADLAMIPVENTVAGRVADIHRLLPSSELYIIGEHFQRVEHCLLGCSGTRLDGIKTIHSHIHALAQCRNIIAQLGAQPVVESDTAVAAEIIARNADVSCAAIATKRAGEINGLECLIHNIEDEPDNTTRFLILSRKRQDCDPHIKAVTSFFFEVRSIPAALYKGLGGFATNQINMTRLESYITNSNFSQALFLAEVEAHIDSPEMVRAMDELRHFSKEVRVLGSFPASGFRDRV